MKIENNDSIKQLYNRHISVKDMQIIIQHKSIKGLDLSMNSTFDQGIFDVICQAKYLKKIYLCHTNITNKDASNLLNNSNLTVFDFYNTDLDDSILTDLLDVNKNYTVVNLGFCRLSSLGYDKIDAFLDTNQQIMQDLVISGAFTQEDHKYDKKIHYRFPSQLNYVLDI